MKRLLLLLVAVAASLACFGQMPGDARPKEADAYETKGNALADAGKFNEAEIQYRSAIAAAPDWYSPHYELGQMFWNKGKENKEKALAELDVALKLNPKCWLCLVAKGNIADDSGETDQAIALYKQATEIEPRSARPYFNLGITLYRKGRLDEAVAAFQHAKQLEPNYPSPVYMLGVVYYKQGKFFLAQDQLDAFKKMETKGPRFDKASELTSVKITLDSSAPESDSTAGLSYCLARSAAMMEDYRKAHPDAETYVEDLEEETKVYDNFAQMVWEQADNGKKTFPAGFGPLVQAKRAGFLKEFLIAASGDHFAKDKASLPSGRMDEFQAWATKNNVTLQMPKPRCEVRWMDQVW